MKEGSSALRTCSDPAVSGEHRDGRKSGAGEGGGRETDASTDLDGVESVES